MVALLHWLTVSHMKDFITCGDVHILFIRELFFKYIFPDRNENSSFLLSTLARNFCQFPGTLAVADTRLVPVPRFPLVHPFIVNALIPDNVYS